MNDQALQNALLRLFERHEVELEADEEWLMTDGDFPAIRATWHPGEGAAPGRLDIDVVLSEERQLEECFAGFGTGDEAVKAALATFERTALHVLLAACWYVTDDRRIDVHSWELGLRTWDVLVGPFSFTQEGLQAPAGLLDGLRAAIGNESLNPELHWIRLFHRRNDDGSSINEALLDNQPWPAGDRLLASLAWPESDGAYNSRCYIALDIRDY